MLETRDSKMHSVEALKCRICINQFIMATIKCSGAQSCIPIPYSLGRKRPEGYNEMPGETPGLFTDVGPMNLNF